jgi:nicotinate-nucleotide pyrophosphorylase (carboxylating)
MGSAKFFLSETEPALDRRKLDQIVRHALIEDIGRGDITTQLTIPKYKYIKAVFMAKEECAICGLPAAQRVFKTVDSRINFVPLVKEGQMVKKGKIIARIQGQARGILTAERVALNLLTMLSGIATKTRGYVKKVEPYKVKITDTRKTIPGLRELQKYAVRIGGGRNHRMTLDEMVLIKDNHLKVSEGYERLPSVPRGFKIEVEVKNLKEFKHALKFKPDVIMLDNMTIKEIKKAVKIRNNFEFDRCHPKTKLETSGRVVLKNVRKIAASGVDIISIGELTHSIKSVDISLEVL